MVVLVTGGRGYQNRAYVWRALSALHARRRITKLVEGGASGADQHAREWARANGIDPTTCDANWQRYGGHAGRVRNVQMLREHRPQLVVRFPGGTGTRHMARISEAAGVPVLDLREEKR